MIQQGHQSKSIPRAILVRIFCQHGLERGLGGARIAISDEALAGGELGDGVRIAGEVRGCRAVFGNDGFTGELRILISDLAGANVRALARATSVFTSMARIMSGK